jgi:energy-coupling factor transporter ATP-binding protein EcfA2
MRYLGLRKGRIVANRNVSETMVAISDADVFPQLQITIPGPPARKSSVGVDDFVLQVQGLSFSFSRNRSLLNDINIELRPSDVLIVRGANGSGKTTLLHLLAGLLRPRVGSVSICGLEPREIPMDRRTEFCSLAFQNPEHQILLEKVGTEIVSAVLSKQTTSDVITALEWMKSCISVAEDSRDPYSLSLGQKKIVTLLTAIISNPRLLLLDEPELGLDMLQKERVAQMLEMIRTHWGTAMVIVTHDQTFMQHLDNARMLDL